MKTFFRSLNIEERKTVIYALSYTIFKTLSSLIIKIMSESYQTGSLTILCERGCMLSIICLFRTVMLIRNSKTKREEILNTSNYKNVLLKGIVSCLSFSFMVFSIYYVSMSTYFIIIRLSPLLSVFMSQVLFGEEMKNYQVICTCIDLIGVSFVLFPPLFGGHDQDDHIIGIICSIVVMLMLSLSDIMNKHMRRTNVDILILFTGIYSAGLGCFLMIMTQEGIENICIVSWILIFLNAIFTYYAILFQTKAIKKASNNVCRLFPFTLLSILMTLFLGVFFFGQQIHSNDTIGILVLISNTIFYSWRVISDAKRIREVKTYTCYE